MALKPYQAFLLVVIGFVSMVVGLVFIYWPAALVIGGGLLIVIGALVINVAPDADPTSRIMANDELLQ